jgi:MFS family permease
LSETSARSLLRATLASVGWWDALATRGPTRLLAINATTDAAGTGLAAVCLPFYAIKVAGLGAAGLALVLSVAGVCELLAAVPNGVAASKFGVARFSTAAKLAQAAVYLVMAFSHGLLALLVISAAGSVARAGANGLNQALTVSALGESERAKALGALRALRNIGYLTAGAGAALILATGSPLALRLALLANGASFVVGAACLIRLRLSSRPQAPGRTDWSVLRDLEYFGLIACAAVFGSSLVVLDVGLPLLVLRHREIPAWTVAVVVMINTLVVIALQYTFSRRISQTSQAVRAVRASAVAFWVMAAIFALAPSVPPWQAVVLLLVAAVALTLGELLESPSWWTVSYELAPADRKNEYLAAFDLTWALIAIAGPAAMAGIVALGATGWLLYGLVLGVAAAAGTWLAQRREARMGHLRSPPALSPE